MPKTVRMFLAGEVVNLMLLAFAAGMGLLLWVDIVRPGGAGGGGGGVGTTELKADGRFGRRHKVGETLNTRELSREEDHER